MHLFICHGGFVSFWLKVLLVGFSLSLLGFLVNDLETVMMKETNFFLLLGEQMFNIGKNGSFILLHLPYFGSEHLYALVVFVSVAFGLILFF